MTESPALATTKRKFHRLLDNLTATTSATSLHSLYDAPHNVSTGSLPRPASPEPAPKRPRSSEAITDRQRQVSAGQARIQALKDQLLTPKRQPTMRIVGAQPKPQEPAPLSSPASAAPRKPPNFQPYSQDLFLARLKTFADVKKWTSKPDPIGEVQWAKRGWSCDTWNTAACRGGCEKRVAVKLRPKRKTADGRDIDLSEDVSHDVAPGLVDRYRALIIDGHEEDCLWRKAGCQDDIHHIPIASRAKSAADLISRYNFLLAMASDLPLAKNITYPGPPVDVILARLPPTYFSSATSGQLPSTPAERTAFAFALFGWTGVSESRISLAVCNHCFQRLGLWLSTDARLQEMSIKLQVPASTLRLNLLESHREHCPWKNPSVQRNPSDSPIAAMPAWQTLEFMLLGSRKHTFETKEKDLPLLPSHNRTSTSISIDTTDTHFRTSTDSARDPPGYNDEGDEESLTNKWRKFKAKLKRSTSKRSLRSVKSVRSAKSVRSGKPGREEDGDEEEGDV